MMKRNDKDLKYLIKKYEAARAKGDSIFLDATDMLDIYDYYADVFRNEEANEVLLRAVKLYPDNEDVVIAHAYYFKNLGQWKQAEDVINKLDQQNIYRKLFYAEEALTMLDLDKSRKLVKEIEGCTAELTCELALDIAEMYYDAGYYHLAEPWLERCYTPKFNEFGRVSCELADCLFRRGDFDRAMTIMNKSLDEDPYDAPSWVQLAKVQFTATKYEEALESCDYAIAANKEYPEAYTVRFDTLLRLERYDEMWEYLQDPAQQIYCSAESVLALAYAYEKEGRSDMASKVYHLGGRLQLEDRDVRDQIHRHLAYEAALEGRHEDVLDLIFRNADRENYIRRYFAMSALLFLIHQEKEAVKALMFARSLPNYGVEEDNQLALLLFDNQVFTKAYEIWDAIFQNAESEGVVNHGRLAYAAYMTHHNLFPRLLQLAWIYDHVTVLTLFKDVMDLSDPARAIQQAEEMVKEWHKAL